MAIQPKEQNNTQGTEVFRYVKGSFRGAGNHLFFTFRRGKTSNKLKWQEDILPNGIKEGFYR